MSRLDPVAEPTSATRRSDVPDGAPSRPVRDQPSDTGTPSHQARRRRDGVVVPLRVPWRTRLRATAGLVTLVVFLGTAIAATIGVIAIVLAQALGSV